MRLPPKLDLGQHSQSPLYTIWNSFKHPQESICDVGPRLLGFVIPPFQRPVVWTDAQMIRFIESLHYGVNPGTYTYNTAYHHRQNEFADDGGTTRYRCGNWLLDGQQRLTSLHRYFTNEWPVFNLYWSDLTQVEKSDFLMHRIFPSYETKYDNELDCRKLYDLMAFGGVPHQEHERALPHNGSEK